MTKYKKCPENYKKSINKLKKNNYSLSLKCLNVRSKLIHDMIFWLSVYCIDTYYRCVSMTMFIKRPQSLSWPINLTRSLYSLCVEAKVGFSSEGIETTKQSLLCIQSSCAKCWTHFKTSQTRILFNTKSSSNQTLQMK